jgi:hypothetical protein
MRTTLHLAFLLSVALLTNGCVVLFYQSIKQHRQVAAMHGKKYSYRVKPEPQFLSEELAVGKAWQTLAREGFQTNEWKLVRSSHPATAPDGRRDRYFSRMRLATQNPARGTVEFKKDPLRRRFDVHLDGSRMICYSLFTGTSAKQTSPR